MDTKKLIMNAKKACLNSYSPYSKLRIGAALVDDSDRIFTGANIENSSYGLTICAERAALFNAVSKGSRKFKKLVVYANDDKITYPCGACLQVLSEFSDDLEIIVTNRSGENYKSNINHLLTNPFKLQE